MRDISAGFNTDPFLIVYVVLKSLKNTVDVSTALYHVLKLNFNAKPTDVSNTTSNNVFCSIVTVLKISHETISFDLGSDDGMQTYGKDVSRIMTDHANGKRVLLLFCTHSNENSCVSYSHDYSDTLANVSAII